MAFEKLVLRLLAAALVLLPLTAVHGQSARDQDGNGSVAGQLLVATPDMGDPRFAHTVILMIAHDGDGAFGVTVNRLVGRQSMDELLDALGEKHGPTDKKIDIFAGGPVQEQIGFILHSPDYADAHTKAVGNGVALTSSPRILRDIGLGKGPHKALVAFGYAGWGPGQLDSEIEKQAWVTVPLDPHLIFDTDPDKRWGLAWARRTLNL
jgi:putative transcriptional regulator